MVTVGSGGGESAGSAQAFEDWLEAQLYLTWDDEAVFRRVCSTFDGAKDAARKADRVELPLPAWPDRGTHAAAWTDADGRETTDPEHAESAREIAGAWLVYAHIDPRSRMRWRLRREGITFGLAERRTPHETVPSAFIRIDGKAILRYGDARTAWLRAVELIESLGCRVERNAITRVDPSLDLPGEGIAGLIAALREFRVVTRAKKSKEEGHLRFTVERKGIRDTGFYVGRGDPVLLRVYDKAIEMAQSPARAQWIKSRCGGRDVETCTRVEFQLRREFLKSLKSSRFNVSTVEDWFSCRARVMEYLTADWIRLLDCDVDRRHTERARVLPQWEFIGREMVNRCSAAWRRLAPLRRVKWSVDQYLAQARGCLERAVALTGEAIETADDFFTAATSLFGRFIHDDGDVVRRTQIKMAEA